MIIRNYNHTSDYQAVISNLKEAGMFDKVWEEEGRLKEFSNKKPGNMIVVELNGEVIGSVFVVDELYPLVFRLVVKKEFRKKGVGSKLLDEAIKRLKKKGIKEIDLFVNAKDTELISWYKKKGFNIGKNSYYALWKEI